MDDNDKKSGDEKSEIRISQIPLLNDIIFDETLPLKAPPRPRRPKTSHGIQDHGPDYDPDTFDLFESPASGLQSFADGATEEELRSGADQLIDELVEEFSAEINRRLRVELTEQLHSILEDLNHKDRDRQGGDEPGDSH